MTIANDLGRKATKKAKTFMLCVVKMLLKGEVGGCALVMEITLLIMENHG